MRGRAGRTYGVHDGGRGASVGHAEGRPCSAASSLYSANSRAFRSSSHPNESAMISAEASAPATCPCGVEGSGLSAPSLRIDMGSGGIDLERVDSDDVILDTGSGSVRVQLENDITELDIDTGSGSVTVWLPEDVGAELEIETGSGGIDVVDFSIQFRKVSRDHLEGSLGDGEGRIRVDTGSGRVRTSLPRSA